MILYFFALAIVLALVVQDALLLLFFTINFREYHHPISEENLPKVSVLIPARNEEGLLPACLKSLESLDYPIEKLEIIMGDDQSTDDTFQLLKDWVSKGENRKLHSVTPSSLPLNGKAIALAQMGKNASGELFLFTDADCEVNPQWIREMVGAFQARNGLVIGITTVSDKLRWGRWQGLDWLLTLGMLKVTADLGNLLTAMGNNMLVSREAYEAVGGFESMPFSVTEDFALGQAIARKGYVPIHQFTENSKLITKAEQDLKALLRQRKRWMRGAFSLPWYWKMLLALQVLFFPMIIYMLCMDLKLGLLIWSVKLTLQVVFCLMLGKKAGDRIPFWEITIFEVYYLVISWSTIVCYFWPSKINWKERKY